MKTTVHTKNYNVSDRLHAIIDKKLSKLDKYFGEDAACTIVCVKVGNVEKMEVTITANGHAFRAQEEDRNMYNNIDLVLSKIERQIVKNKERLKTIIRKEAVDEKHFAYLSKYKAGNIFISEIKKNKSFAIKVLSDKDAELDLSTLDHNFFVYADEHTKGVKVMYNRGDGSVGIIEITNACLK